MKNVVGVLILGLVFLLASCGSKTPLTNEQKIYAGKWVANDGTWLQIYNDGGGDFKKSNSNVTGGNAVITESTITIGLMGLDTEYEITKSPYELEGDWFMELDGDLYFKN